MSPVIAPLNQLARSPASLVRRTTRDPGWIPELFKGMESRDTGTRFGCAKALVLLSEQHPAMLYPYFQNLAQWLKHPNKIFQWQGARVLANLACVDDRNQIAKIFDVYFAPITGPVMITAANVIKGGATIARAKPILADAIAEQMMRVGRARYQTRECRHVAIGHALLALGKILDLLSKPAAVRSFARRHLNNPRAATRKKAASLLRQVQNDASARPA